jgi:two-component system response regulator HydG
MSELNRVSNFSSANVAAAPAMISQAPPPALWLGGSSAAMTHLRGQIRRVAPYFRTALFVGEPGCGEEAAAQILHQQSPLSQRPFISLESAEALSLFGGARSEDALASVGMFYISRPDRLSPIAQTALLLLVRRYGPQAPRIVAFAERGLRPLVSANGFSPELADFLGSLRIVIPPLRDRSEDIPQLLSSLLQRIAAQSGAPLPQLAPDLMDAARLLPWQGNLPQLHSAAEGLMERANQHILHAPDLDAVLGSISQPASPHPHEIRMIRLDDVIQEHIRSVLFACNGNKLRTAEVLGISRSTLYRMLDIPTHPCAPPSHPQSVDSSNLRMAG